MVSTLIFTCIPAVSTHVVSILPHQLSQFRATSLRHLEKSESLPCQRQLLLLDQGEAIMTSPLPNMERKYGDSPWLATRGHVRACCVCASVYNSCWLIKQIQSNEQIRLLAFHLADRQIGLLNQTESLSKLESREVDLISRVVRSVDDSVIVTGVVTTRS